MKYHPKHFAGFYKCTHSCYRTFLFLFYHFTMALPTMTPSQYVFICFTCSGEEMPKPTQYGIEACCFIVSKTVKISLECISDTGNAGRGYAIQKSFAICRNGSNTVFRCWGDKINWIYAMGVNTFINFVMFFKRKVRYNDGINSCFLT